MQSSQIPTQVDLNDIIPSNVGNPLPKTSKESLCTQDGLKQDPVSSLINIQISGSFPVPMISPEKENQMDQTNLELNNPLEDGIEKKAQEAQKIQPTSSGLLGKIRNKKLLLIGILTGIFALIGMSVFLAIHFSSHDHSDGSSTVFTCADYPEACTGVSQTVQNFVIKGFNDPDQAQSILQVARALQTLPINSTIPIPRQNLTTIFRNITRSVQCMYFNMPDTYMGAFEKLSQLQMSTQTSVETYLSMLESFSGQPLKLTNQFELEQTCQFNISQARRRLLQQNVAPRAGNACVANASSLMIYFSGIGYSPSSIIQTIYKTQLILLGNTNTSYDAGIVALGAWRSDGNLGFHSNLVTNYSSYLKENNQTVPSMFEMYSALRIILNSCRTSEYIPSTVLGSLIRQLLPFFIQKSLESFIKREQDYELEKHKNFVEQQIAQGKRITFAAHAEGAYYASKVYSLLSQTHKRSVSLVYIAPMVSSMPDGSTNYITNPNDLMIEAIRSLSLRNSIIPNPLPANIPAANFSQSVDIGLNHELTGYATAYKDLLLNMIISAMTTTVQPPQQLGNGPITITLTWDTLSDMDLHVYQPDNTQVYYGFKNGSNGFLDQDNQSGFGPEHYYTNCDLSTGNYFVYVNFFHGTSPTKITLTIMAGSQYSLIDYTFDNSARFLNFARINVIYNNSTRSYSYEIYLH